MKMSIAYIYQAQQDLKDIYEYIAYSLSAPKTAQSIYQKSYKV